MWTKQNRWGRPQQAKSESPRVVDPFTFRSFLSRDQERKIAARWRWWEPLVGIYLLRRRGRGPAEVDRMRSRHSQRLTSLMWAGIDMRLVRRHRLDDPRISDELHAVLVRAVRERRATRRGRAINDSTPGQQRCERRTSARPEIAKALGKTVEIITIQERVRDHFQLREFGDQNLQVCSNRQIFTLPRQLAMYLARQLTTLSLPEIGRQFGGIHHTTVLHAIHKIQAMRHKDGDLDHMITALMEALQQV